MTRKLAHTYSIIAVDTERKEMGIGVQSHYFSVGSVVPWAEAGVGVVATQALVNPEYGPQGLKLLRSGAAPDDALKTLLEHDEGSRFRQAALLTPQEPPATHTGSHCIREAGHASGATYSAQANMMLNDTVWNAMSTAFEAADAPLAERLLAALHAAEDEGGDIRGRQSAALLIVSTESHNDVLKDRLLDLRVDDHTQPLAEMDRLLVTHRAYEAVQQGDTAMEAGDTDRALLAFSRARNLAPDNTELQYWHAVTLADSGHRDEAQGMLQRIYREDANWKELTRRLVEIGLVSRETAEL
jgi:uncharacterized Ntn-hydrolase superfamily protein